MTKAFQVGDRVVCWIYGCIALKGRISFVQGDALDVTLDKPFGDEKQTVWPVHAKQVRRLVRKPRRRVWISGRQLSEYFEAKNAWDTVEISARKMEDDDIEFREVRPVRS